MSLMASWSDTILRDLMQLLRMLVNVTKQMQPRAGHRQTLLTYGSLLHFREFAGPRLEQAIQKLRRIVMATSGRAKHLYRLNGKKH